jgi:hypothetical protein
MRGLRRIGASTAKGTARRPQVMAEHGLGGHGAKHGQPGGAQVAVGPEGFDGQDDEEGGEGEVQALEAVQRQPGAGQGAHGRAGDPEQLEQ